MKKRVLVISGSPRAQGNSQRLCQQFKAGALEAGHEVEQVNLRELTIGYCIACYECKKSGVCFQKDDMAKLLEQMVHADVIVMATPVYFYTMDGQMKVMIDRTLPRYTEISNKEFYFIATAADNKKSMERTIDGFYAFTDCLNAAVVRQVILGSGAWQIGDIEGSPALEEAYMAGLQI